jgi:hypothetical protein
METEEQSVSDKVMAAIDLIGRTGAKWMQIRFSEDEEPVVWIAVAGYTERGVDGPMQVGAGLDAESAYMALCGALIDGGQCKHCGHRTAFADGPERGLSLGNVCRTEWDPEKKKYTQSCGGREGKEKAG